MSPYPWKWKTSIRAGGNGQEGHQSTTANSLEKITRSTACHNETAALVITGGGYLMAMCKRKKALLLQAKQRVALAARCYRGFLLNRGILMLFFHR